MRGFLKSKAGLSSLVAFAAMMALMLHRVASRRHERLSATPAIAIQAGRERAPASAAASKTPAAPEVSKALTENAAYLERYYDLGRHTRDDQDRQGNRMTRRDTAVPHPEASTTFDADSGGAAAGPTALRASLRLQGRRGGIQATPVGALDSKLEHSARTPLGTLPASVASGTKEARKPRPQRFNPYGRVIKCELVFTIDSTSEQCPLVGVVMEPVYNNGALVIPAGAEFHGVARPDRLRDRIFSGQDWVLVFPREPARISGRQLNVKGVALDRIEPDANGMTWGITDGSYGLEGRIIRTMNDEEIKRFVATFLAGSSVALQDRNTDRTGQQTTRNTPQNAVLQGLAANFEKIAEEISAEIAQHGVFIRVPAGHQFYFYPMQIIDPDAADVSSDIATVK